jgi:DNA mismatch repair ATPase MutS
VFTHYRRKEDISMRSGKLDEELSRMSVIVDHVQPNALVLFNESFSATNEREGSEIARQITSALLEQNIRVFFVTHMYEFSHYYYEQHLEYSTFLRAERKSGGRRTFKLSVGEPLSTSFGEDVYNAIFLNQGNK